MTGSRLEPLFSIASLFPVAVARKLAALLMPVMTAARGCS